MTASVDDFGEVLRASANREIREILETLSPSEMTPLEVLGVLAVLRRAMARHTTPTAARLKLVKR